jgi:hypothetical protein
MAILKAEKVVDFLCEVKNGNRRRKVISVVTQ